MIRTRFVIGVLGLTLCTLAVTHGGVVGAGSTAPAASALSSTVYGSAASSDVAPSLPILASRATNAARQVFGHPQLVEAHGIVAGGEQASAWRFIFNDEPGRNRESVVVEVSSEGEVASREVHPGVRTGSRVLASTDLTRLKPIDAVRLLRAAGHAEEIVRMVVQRPVGPADWNAQYFFADTDGRTFAAVDTRTRRVIDL